MVKEVGPTRYVYRSHAYDQDRCGQSGCPFEISEHEQTPAPWDVHHRKDSAIGYGPEVFISEPDSDIPQVYKSKEAFDEQSRLAQMSWIDDLPMYMDIRTKTKDSPTHTPQGQRIEYVRPGGA